MGAAIWHHLLPPNETPHSLDATRTSRKAAESSRSFALRLQRVDGRRFAALVADILCSRLHGVAAPTVSYVSAPLVRRASVHLPFVRICEFNVRLRLARVWRCVRLCFADISWPLSLIRSTLSSWRRVLLFSRWGPINIGRAAVHRRCMICPRGATYVADLPRPPIITAQRLHNPPMLTRPHACASMSAFHPMYY